MAPFAPRGRDNKKRGTRQRPCGAYRGEITMVRAIVLRAGMAAAFAIAAAAAQAQAPQQTQQQAWPTRPVTLVVPFPAGGPVDVAARFFSQHLSERLGQQFVIENIGGAGGWTGAARVAKAPADGSV